MAKARTRDNYNAKYNVIINLHDENGVIYDYELFKEKLKSYVALRNINYWSILHDKDVLDTGELKRPHVHVVLKMSSRVDKSIMINELSSHFGVADVRITLSGVMSLTGCIRYLMHCDDKDKYQYTQFEVNTNDDVMLDTALKNHSDIISVDYLIDTCNACHGDLIAVMRVLGLESYNKWRNVVRDIIYRK